ncbi:MAG: hypothetical protein R3246_17200, partial [Acidimicrobiia bacterium]|nr:hypothetical protein [Acidimicrobiia bacterium]
NTATGSAQDTLTVLAPPVIEKTFDPLLVLLGVTPDNLSALVFTVSNPNPFNAISGVAFTDNLPTDLLVAATPNVVTSGCGSPTVTAAAGTGTIGFSGGSIAAGGVCVVSVDVEGPIGVYDNISDNVSHVVGGVSLDGNNATAQLVVDEPIPAIALLKQVGLGSDPEGAWQQYLPVEVGTDVYYKLTIENVGELELTNIAASDPTLDITGCTWPASLPVAEFNIASPDDHIAECVVGPITISAPGEYPNTATASGDYSIQDPTLDPPLDLSGTVFDSDNATIATVGLSIDKQADRATFDSAGQTINYDFTVTNSGSAILEGPVTVTDPLIGTVSCPAVSTVGNGDNFFD